MRKYYLFIIRDEVADAYKNNLKDLYICLYELHNGKFNNLNYRISLFEQICLSFKVNVINNYFKHLFYIKQNNKKYLYKKNGEVSVMEISYSNIVIITNRNFPYFFNVLNLYNKKILVCDFFNHDYFWLSKQNTKIKSFEYN
ncbi:MAG: sporulation inhibitor of replication protein SirA [Bacilli bacterium]|nr:sporulation inhibitor of replication protein SirA [Bacilli bacterium]MDD4282640.1 sporulation inhibitor of replication protein SirA [Bacilli bacterium]MDD4719077.1 sporulation inhibitor of replication protein SirA [Bacilli bacterium]